MSASALVGTRSLPKYFSNFFTLTAQPDDCSICEYEGFVQQKVVLKCFPFDANRLALVLPTTIEGKLPSREFTAKDLCRGRFAVQAKKVRLVRKTLPVIKIPKLASSRGP
jgi:hypothetical protein